MPVVHFQPTGTRGEIPDGTSLLDAAVQVGVELNHVCGGHASCSTCRVYVLNGMAQLSEIQEDEQARLDLEFLDPPYRLACQVRVTGDVTVLIPEE